MMVSYRAASSLRESSGQLVLDIERYARFVTSGTVQLTAAQLRCIAIDQYQPLRAPIPPGTLLNHTSGRAHQISRAKATAASAPPNCRPSESKSRISRNNSSRMGDSLGERTHRWLW